MQAKQAEDISIGWEGKARTWVELRVPRIGMFSSMKMTVKGRARGPKSPAGAHVCANSFSPNRVSMQSHFGETTSWWKEHRHLVARWLKGREERRRGSGINGRYA